MKLIILYETYVWLCKIYADASLEYMKNKCSETLEHLVGIGRVGQHFVKILALNSHASHQCIS